MKQFLISGRTQNVVNVVTGVPTLLGTMALFIAGNVAPLWLGVTTITTLVTFLAYNMWVSLELDNQRRSNQF